MNGTNKKWASAQQKREVQVKVFGLKPNGCEKYLSPRVKTRGY